MRHRAKGRQLSRTASHKKALMNNMAASLFLPISSLGLSPSGSSPSSFSGLRHLSRISQNMRRLALSPTKPSSSSISTL